MFNHKWGRGRKWGNMYILGCIQLIAVKVWEKQLQKQTRIVQKTMKTDFLDRIFSWFLTIEIGQYSLSPNS
jgi:hypothetical protein